MNDSGTAPAQAAGRFELGLYTFGDIIPDARTGRALSAQQRLHEIIAAAKLADEAGLDVFGVGEHHRLDFAISSPAVVMAAIAQVTKRIRLTSATTVLSTLDPVRVFQDYATVDLISSGRAELIAGRGAFVESFPLFGLSLDDYEQLFAEKIEMLLELGAKERVTWSGEFRAPLREAPISPRPAQPRMPVWIGVGGTPESAVRAGLLGTGMSLALIGGNPAQFKPFVEIYRQAGAEAGHAPETLRVGVASHGYVAKTSQQAVDDFYPHYERYFGTLMRERGRPGGFTRLQVEQAAGLHGALFVGSPQQIIDKLLHHHELFAHDRYLMQLDVGGLPFEKVASAIELLATEVAPVVRREIAHRMGRVG